MITQQQALEALCKLTDALEDTIRENSIPMSDRLARAIEKGDLAILGLEAQQAEDSELLDCGEAGHAEGRCGNASCMRVKK